MLNKYSCRSLLESSSVFWKSGENFNLEWLTNPMLVGYSITCNFTIKWTPSQVHIHYPAQIPCEHNTLMEEIGKTWPLINSLCIKEHNLANKEKRSIFFFQNFSLPTMILHTLQMDDALENLPKVPHFLSAFHSPFFVFLFVNHHFCNRFLYALSIIGQLEIINSANKCQDSIY